ncbi:hypothetical protein [Litoribrevibacter albus]|uniref:Uncharacterized protein n=1 Tax=Litoribrevibacter albus TaxID=1473156 RepID=A0AA37W8Y3_9GAMM|nr:hypothetical protein [Litoribrevibacter albus]GLQ32006.1 hypothetical protein GCM10007876_24850 [Litoribrevibacter albus]
MTRFSADKSENILLGVPTKEDPILVVCPKCKSKAAIIPANESEYKATCFQCGFNELKKANHKQFNWYSDNPTDGVFGFDLWLRTECNGNSLWAFNKEHLNFLNDYVSAHLRERSKDEKWGWSNSSLASRLPKWIKSAKNRESILKSITVLKSKA